MSGAHAKQKPKKKKITIKTILIAFAVVVVIGAVCGRTPKDDAAAPTPTPTEAAIVEQSEEVTSSAPWRENPLDAINLTPDQRITLYDELDAALLSGQKTEDEIVSEAAEKYGITADEVNTIYTYASLGYLYDINPADLKVQYGETLDVTIMGTTLIVKAKISPSYNNDATIKQNYHSVEDLILKQGCDRFSEIQYWAVADMQDGSEGKVISFTCDKSMIRSVAEGRLVAIQFGDYVQDLWILPSLLQ